MNTLSKQVTQPLLDIGNENYSDIASPIPEQSQVLLPPLNKVDDQNQEGNKEAKQPTVFKPLVDQPGFLEVDEVDQNSITSGEKTEDRLNYCKVFGADITSVCQW